MGTIEKSIFTIYCDICDNEKKCIILKNKENELERYRFIIICKDCLKEALKMK